MSSLNWIGKLSLKVGLVAQCGGLGTLWGLEGCFVLCCGSLDFWLILLYYNIKVRNQVSCDDLVSRRSGEALAVRTFKKDPRRHLAVSRKASSGLQQRGVGWKSASRCCRWGPVSYDILQLPPAWSFL